MADVNATHPGNPINDDSRNNHPGRSSFDLTYPIYSTMRFADLTPHYVEEAVSGDVIRLYSKHDLRTYTLGAPIMSNLSMHKDYFQVPMEAILPLNWERIYTNPTIGDDVPVMANCVVPDFPRKLKTYFEYNLTNLKSKLAAISTSGSFGDTEVNTFMCQLLQFMVTAEYFYSNGSLIKYLGYSMDLQAEYFSDLNNVTGYFDSFDTWFDAVCALFKQLDTIVIQLGILGSNTPGQTYTVVPEIGDTEATSKRRVDNAISLRSMLEIVRDSPYLYSVTCTGDDNNIAAFTTPMQNLLNGLVFSLNDDTVESVPFNYARAAAYQIVVSHFYTNDHVDYVYDANLYRQNIQSILDKYRAENNVGPNTSAQSRFTWNGLKLEYDALAGYWFNYYLSGSLNVAILRNYTAIYMSLLFGFRRSLRFVDYFTGSRTQPLAVGDTSVTVANNAVDVIDMTRKIQYTRFWNQVNRVGRKISDYVSGLFGNSMAPDYHNPFFLSGTTDDVFSTENENTADGQTAANAITSNMRANSSRYAFEFHADRESIVIGITYFDIPRSYAHASDRQMYIQDRFDMFNPYLQYIGDQDILRNEIDCHTTENDAIFAYTTRHMEYKQRIPRAVGGFVENLPGWTFVADNVAGKYYPVELTPSFIRSSNVEMDPFYTALTGYSDGSYFHFIVKSVNADNALRKMIVNPNILQ